MDIAQPTPRPSLMKFARHCEAILRDNDHKVGWHDMSLGELVGRIGDELAELGQALHDCDPQAIKKEAADVANFAMMIHDLADNLSE